MWDRAVAGVGVRLWGQSVPCPSSPSFPASMRSGIVCTSGDPLTLPKPGSRGGERQKVLRGAALGLGRWEMAAWLGRKQQCGCGGGNGSMGEETVVQLGERKWQHRGVNSGKFLAMALMWENSWEIQISWTLQANAHSNAARIQVRMISSLPLFTSPLSLPQCLVLFLYYLCHFFVNIFVFVCFILLVCYYYFTLCMKTRARSWQLFTSS